MPEATFGNTVILGVFCILELAIGKILPRAMIIRGMLVADSHIHSVLVGNATTYHEVAGIGLGENH